MGLPSPFTQAFTIVTKDTPPALETCRSGRYHPPRSAIASPFMTVSPAAIETLQRLVEQVQALSSVVETLTLRLLDLEERLQHQEHLANASNRLTLEPGAERLLAETEERLQGLEQMLAPAVTSHPALSLHAPAEVTEPLDGPDPVFGNAAAPPNGQLGEVEAAPEGLAEDELGWQIEDDWTDQERLIA